MKKFSMNAGNLWYVKLCVYGNVHQSGVHYWQVTESVKILQLQNHYQGLERGRLFTVGFMSPKGTSITAIRFCLLTLFWFCA